MALAAGKKRQSMQTGMVHLAYEAPCGKQHDTIPIFENFCYALALLRSRHVEHMTEGKALVERLLPFQVEGNFPVYLHEYPRCRDRGLAAQLLPVFFWMIKDFGFFLGELVKAASDKALQFAMKTHEEKALPSHLLNKILAFRGEEIHGYPVSQEEWGEFLIAAQMVGNVLQVPWDSDLQIYRGPQKVRLQYQGEPLVTLFDLFMMEQYHFSSERLLRDHPLHLKAALVHPYPDHPSQSEARCIDFRFEQNHEEVALLWKKGNQLHSLSCDIRGEEIKCQQDGQSMWLEWGLPQEIDEDEEVDIAFFCNLHPENHIFINELKGTAFDLNDVVEIGPVRLVFTLIDGEGMFRGHIARGNRHSQVRREDIFTVYDWKIGLRSLRKKSPCKIGVQIIYGCNAGLSTAMPIACIPLST